MTAGASRITKRIDTIVFVRRALQVFIAREVNKTGIFIYSRVVAVLVIAFKNRLVVFLLFVCLLLSLFIT